MYHYVSTPSSVDAQTIHRVLLAYYRILQANRPLPRLLDWPLAPLSQLIWSPHPDNGVRFLAIRCYALQVGMSEGERVKIEKEVKMEVSPVETGSEHVFACVEESPDDHEDDTRPPSTNSLTVPLRRMTASLPSRPRTPMTSHPGLSPPPPAKLPRKHTA